MYHQDLATVTTPTPGNASDPALSGRRAALCLLVILAGLYVQMFFGRILFTRDIAHWTFPARWLVHHALRAGELPLWNPYQGLGFPVLGDPLYGVFYPPNWLLLLFPERWLPNGLTLLDFLHMAWGGLGAYALARRLRATPTASLVAGLAWSLSGYMTSQWTAGLRLHAGAWIPWVTVGHLALLDDLRAGGRHFLRGIVKAALPTGLALLMGEIFLAIMGVALAAAMVAIVHLSERRDDATAPAYRWTWPLAHAIALVLAVALGAIVIVPARAVMASSPRAHALTKETAEAASLHPLRLIEFAAPQSMGDVYGDYPAAPIVGEPRLDGLPLSYSVYFGASILALVLAAFRRQVLVLGIAAVTLVALLTALGKHLPVHALVRRLIPPLSYMRFPEKYLTLVVVGVAVLAALGAKRVLSQDGQPWRRTAVFLAALVTLGLSAPFVFPYPWSGFMVHGLRHGAVAILAILGVQLLAARGSRLAAPMLVAVVVLDLASSAMDLQAFIPAQIASNQPDAVRTLNLQMGARPLHPPRLYRASGTDAALAATAPVRNPGEGELRLLATFIPSTVNVWGIATLPGYDAAIPAQLNELWTRGQQNRLAALQLLGANYAVLPANVPLHDERAKADLHPLFDPVPGARVFRIDRHLPPVYVVSHAEPLPDTQTLSRIFEPSVLAAETAWLAPDATAIVGDEGKDKESSGSCSLETYAAAHLQARCHADRPGYAVFTEQYDPGWTATVDGRATGIVRANLVMRAVPLPAGDHVIHLDYHAPGLRLGLSVTLAALLGLAGLAWAGKSES
jgi:hypothetical protein